MPFVITVDDRRAISRHADLYNVALPQPEIALSFIVVGLERLRDPNAFLTQVRAEADALSVRSEIVALPGVHSDYGAALRAGFHQARGSFIISLDPDVAGPLTFIRDLWTHRCEGEIVIASRYAPGSRHEMSALRTAGSTILNATFRRGLSLGIRDVSSALRLYRADVVKDLKLEARDYDILEEALVRAFAAGWRVIEIPYTYAPNPALPTKAHVRLATAYLRTFWALWKLRNSIAAADYDYRAHDSVIPLQRFWQRSRYRYITELVEGQGAVLDVGCGSSHIIGALAPGSVALDILINKLRFARRFRVPLVRGSGFALPFEDESFSCVLCSQVIEHVPMAGVTPSILDELCRVLKPGGRLVLGTPDYDRPEWVYIEKAYGFFAPGGYADEHISHYTRKGLLEEFERRGYRHEATRYILRAELILAFRKPA
ncbi:MAG TPA: methyltransferase domain-containing protein [Vicinamibacterales bacterium]